MILRAYDSSAAIAGVVKATVFVNSKAIDRSTDKTCFYDFILLLVEHQTRSDLFLPSIRKVM